MHLQRDPLQLASGTALETAAYGPLVVGGAVALCLVFSVWKATQGDGQDSRDRALKIVELLIKLFHRGK